MPFDQSDSALLTVRDNMLRGLDAHAAAIDTLHVSPGPKACPPAIGAYVTLVLLRQVDAELVSRGHPSTIGEYA